MILYNGKHKLVKACVSDLEDIKFFEKKVLNDCSEYSSTRTLKKLIKSNNSLFLLIKESSNIICGYGIVTLRHYKYTPSGHIYKIAISNAHRKIGLATKLLKELEKFVLDNNFHKIFAEIRESNKASLNLFNKLGYKHLKTLFGYYSCLNQSYDLENGIKVYKYLY
jgi:ribosomal protein S18 acetylase RimI-like enzyme